MTTACCNQVLEILSMVRFYQVVRCLDGPNRLISPFGNPIPESNLWRRNEYAIFDAAFITGDQLSSSMKSQPDLCHNPGYPRCPNSLLGKATRISEI
jgi:hypothetical protein